MREIEERQSAELEFVSAAYSVDEAWITYQGNDGIPVIHRKLIPPMDGSKSMQNELKNHYVCIDLTLTMPKGYLVTEDDILEVNASISSDTSDSVRKLAIDSTSSLLLACRKVASECAGEEAVFSVMNCADEWMDHDWCRILSAKHIQEEVSSLVEPTNNMSLGKKIVLGRRLIYSHHIIAKTKRSIVADLASQNNLGGFVKIGWPGIILIEGHEDDCIMYVEEIKKLRWQYLVVRGEQQVELENESQLNNQRKLPNTFRELAENQMSDLATICKDSGLEDLFLTSMKIYKEDAITCSSDSSGVLEKNCSNDEQQEIEETYYGTLVHVDHMNDGKGYRKWLRKVCKSTGCFLISKEIYIDDNSKSKPLILIGLVGDKTSVVQVLKRWRTTRVDVDSTGHPCLERMSTVLCQGFMQSSILNDLHELDDENNFNVTTKQMIDVLRNIGGDQWVEALNNLLSSIKKR